MTKSLEVHDLGRIGFKEAYSYQMELRNQVKQNSTTPFHLVFCEHEPVITKGRNFEKESLPYPEDFYLAKQISLEKVDRGGDVTFHGPGQITAYYIFDLNHGKKDIHHFIHQLEEVVIHCLKDFQVEAGRNIANSGVWVGEEKICAIGVGFKHWISYHGIGFNVNTNMDYFKDIVPCGLKNKGVTNLKNVLKSSKDINLELVKEKLIQHTTQVFGLQSGLVLEQQK